MFTRWRLHRIWWRTSNCSPLLIYRPREDERLSWPGWLTYSGRLTQISGPPSATDRAQDGERTLARDWRSTAVQPEMCSQGLNLYWIYFHITRTFKPFWIRLPTFCRNLCVIIVQNNFWKQLVKIIVILYLGCKFLLELFWQQQCIQYISQC